MMNRIPKVAHCFWYHPQGLPYLRFLSIASFALLNPDFELVMYSPTKPLPTGRVFNTHEQGSQLITADCTPMLRRLDNVTFKQVDPTACAFPANLASTAVHFTDLFRLELLSTVGGYWMDSDIIFTRPLGHSIFSAPEFANADTLHTMSSLGPICPYSSHRISFMGASVGNPFFGALFEAAINRNNNGDYEVFGASLYQAVYPTIEHLLATHPDCTFAMMPTASIYGIDLAAFQSYRLSMDRILESPMLLGVHWYGGGDHLADLYNKVAYFDPKSNRLQNILDNPNLFEKLFLFAEALALPFIADASISE